MKIKVLSVDGHDKTLGISVGDVYTVTGIDPDGDFYIDPVPEDYNSDYHVSSVRVLYHSQVEAI